MFNTQTHYIKLTGTKLGHHYLVECYNRRGELIETTPHKLSELDKITFTNKLRIRKGRVWARLTDSQSLMTVRLPKFAA